MTSVIGEFVVGVTSAIETKSSTIMDDAIDGLELFTL